MRARTIVNLVSISVITIGIGTLIAQPSTADPFRFRNPFRKQTSVEKLASEIDDLEEHIDTYGSVVAKKPDIWGESRLMRYRGEYEKKLREQNEKFEERINASIQRSDTAFLASALSLQAASGRPSTIVRSVGAQEEVTERRLQPREGPKAQEMISDFDIITRTQSARVSGGLGFGTGNKVALEPTVAADQLSRYLKHLRNLRALNEGGDNADAPGYALHMMRIPVSVFAGKKTRRGYGAEVTMSITPVFGDDFLPKTLRHLVINDVADQLSLPLTKLLNNKKFRDEIEKTKGDLETIRKLRREIKAIKSTIKQLSSRGPEPGRPDLKREQFISNRFAVVPPSFIGPTKKAQMQLWNNRLNTQQDNLMNMFTKPSILKISKLTSQFSEHQFSGGTAIRRSRLPIPPSFVEMVFGTAKKLSCNEDADEAGRFFWLLYVADESLKNLQQTADIYHHPDVKRFLVAELEAAYDFLNKTDEANKLWSHANPTLAEAVRSRGRTRGNQTIKDLRTNFYRSLNSGMAQDAHNTITSVLSWAIIVESALLSDHLNDDMQSVAKRCGGNCGWDYRTRHHFCGKHLDEAAKRAFEQYVRCRWPIHVFAIDPMTQDQNVADSFSRRRETQLALALGFTNGQINAETFKRLARRTETDMESIALNRTSVGFSHGSDTFGWRFYPRVQSPRVRSNIRTWLGDNLIGPPSADRDLRDRKLEPGIRECTALVIMPSFLPRVMVDSRSNWFDLTNPRRKMLTLRDTMKLSKTIVSMHDLSNQCMKDAHRYRDGAVWRLKRSIDQLDARLPLQTAHIDVPIENTHGGFELFSAGVTDLGPELHGYYGSPGVSTKEGATTSVFLVGENFSVHDTRVIAGNKDVTESIELLSRQVMKVDIPANVNKTDEGVDVHIATPYGVSAHLDIPLAEVEAPKAPESTGFAWNEDSVFTTYIKYDSDNGGIKTLLVEDKAQVVPFAITGDGIGLPFEDQAEAEFAAFITVKSADGTVLLNNFALKGGEVAVDPAGKVGAVKFTNKNFVNPIKKAMNDAKIGQSMTPTTIEVVGYIRIKKDQQPVFKMGKSLTVKIVERDDKKKVAESQ